MKLLPLRINVNPPLPAMTLSGERLERVGSGLLTAKVSDHMPPPGAGVNTEIEGNAAVATSLAGVGGGRWGAVAKVEGRVGPVNRATRPRTKVRQLRGKG